MTERYLFKGRQKTGDQLWKESGSLLLMIRGANGPYGVSCILRPPKCG